MTGHSSLPRYLWLLAFLPYAWLVERHRHLIDDAFISFRYAHHLAIGEGLRYNLGDSEPVEGFSNFSWVLLLSLGDKLGIAPEHLSVLAGIACGAVLLACVYHFATSSLKLGTVPALCAVSFLACFPPFAVWSTGGLETSAFALALFAAWAELVRPQGARPLRATGFALLVVTLRPEGLVWAFGLLLAAYVARGRRELDRRLVVRYLVPLVVGVALLLTARWVYYDDWLSNTARAKGSLSAATLARGVKYAASYFAVFVSPLIIVLLTPLALRSTEKRLVASTGLMLGAGVLWSAVAGGDWMPFFRFLAPLTPFLALLLGAAVASLPRSGVVATAALIVVAALPSWDVHVAPQGLREALYFRETVNNGYETEQARLLLSRKNVARYRQIGQAVAGIAEPGDSLVQGAIGVVGYYSGVTIHDRNGLVDREVARQESSKVRSAGHDKTVPRIFFAERRPTWFDVRYAPAKIESDDVWRRLVAPLLKSDVEVKLLEQTEPEVVEVPADAEGNPAFSLLLIKRCDSQARARKSWLEIGPKD